MPPHKKKITFVKAIKFFKPPSAPNGSIEEKLKSLDKSPNTAKKQTFQYQKIGENISKSLTKVP